MLEPLSYPLEAGSTLSSSEKRFIVTETARRLVVPGVDVLKAEFPLDPQEADEKAWSEACQEISSACPAPWILLSAAVDYERYLHQVEIACLAGASGVAAGRAVWQEAVGLQGKPRLDFLQTTARARLRRLAVLCGERARPIQQFYRSPVGLDWYPAY